MLSYLVSLGFLIWYDISLHWNLNICILKVHISNIIVLFLIILKVIQ